MMRTPSRRRALRRILIVPALAGWIALGAPAGRSRAQVEPPSRQVTLFGIVATPGSDKVDKKLATIAPQLRKLLPNHGFKLLKVESKRLGIADVLGGDFGQVAGVGYGAETQLLDALDVNGKVQVRFAFYENGAMQSSTIVTTPPNQLFFVDKALADGSRLILGIGAR